MKDTPYTYEEFIGRCRITKYNGTEVAAIIPNRINGLPVIAIEAHAFANLPNLKRVVLPAHLRYIAKDAFENCPLLEYLALPDGLRQPDPDVVRGCPAYKGVLFGEDHRYLHRQEGVIYNKEMTRLIECPAHLQLTELVVPESVREIGLHAFDGCDTLERVILPEGLTDIGEAAFSGCSALREINLPQGIRRLEKLAFNDCGALDSLEVPPMMEYVADNIFGNQ